MNPPTEAFNQKRRQSWLDEHYFHWAVATFKEDIVYWILPANGTEIERKANAAMIVARDRWWLFLLRYTGGEAIEPMREELERVVAAYEAYAPLRRLAHEDPDFPPFLFGELDEYEATFQIIGLCYLLHRRDLLPRIAAMQDPYYRAQDTLYEDLLAYELEGRYDVDKWFHDKPYRDLINSFYRDTDEESIEDIVRYLDGWYPGMTRTVWHGGHLKQDQGFRTYHGYWAIGAAAATFLLELDDSSYRDHPMYPKDLVDFARRYKADALEAEALEGQGSEVASLSRQSSSRQMERPDMAASSQTRQDGAANRASTSRSSGGLSIYDELIGGYRTHTHQSVFIDRQGDGYGLWMLEEEDDVWQDHAETYMPMTADVLRRYFVQPGDADDAMGVGSPSGTHGEVYIAIIRARPGAALACGGVVPSGGVFAMNGALFVPFTADRAVGADYVMYANE